MNSSSRWGVKTPLVSDDQAMVGLGNPYATQSSDTVELSNAWIFICESESLNTGGTEVECGGAVRAMRQKLTRHVDVDVILGSTSWAFG